MFHANREDREILWQASPPQEPPKAMSSSTGPVTYPQTFGQNPQAHPPTRPNPHQARYDMSNVDLGVKDEEKFFISAKALLMILGTVIFLYYYLYLLMNMPSLEDGQDEK